MAPTRGPRGPSALVLTLATVLLFASHVLAVAAVLGIDLGTEYIKASLVKPGIPLEIVLTKDSRRKETSAVAFKPPPNGPPTDPSSYPERLYGSDAMALAPRYPHEVYPNLKKLLGLPAGHEVVQEYAARHPALNLTSHKTRDTAAFRSSAFAPEFGDPWLVEELLAMKLQSVVRNAEALAGSGTSVRSVVLTVPPFYTVEEKRAVKLAARLAGLKVLSLISDGLAVGLNYATTRSFPTVGNATAKPEIHMVFDMGAGSTKATIMRFQSRVVKDVGKFNKTIQEVAVLGSGWDRTLGGDALNALIIDDMVANFVESPGAKKISATAEAVKKHGRAVAKLAKDAERIRHVLSANTNTQASFEGLYEDVDFRYKLSRADFEKMAEEHAERVGAVVQRALDMAGLSFADLDSVILHGGASRTPFVQRQLEKVVGTADKIRTNVNSDEAAVFGAGFRAADLSPSFRVKEIRISDTAAYPAGMRWTNAATGKEQHQRLWTATSALGGPGKEVTFPNMREDFSVSFYQQVGPDEERPTKTMTTKNLTASVAHLTDKFSCLPTDIQYKVNLRLSAEDGEVEVVKAHVECEGDVLEKEGFVDGVKNLFGFGNKKEQQPLSAESEGSTETSSAETSSSTTAASESATSSSSAEAASSDGPSSSTTSPEAEATPKTKKTKKLVTVPVEFVVEKAGIPQLELEEIKVLRDRIKAFEASDVSRRQREEALNQLEGYTYKVRDLLDGESFIAMSSAEERETLEKKATEASEWLYGDGAEASKEELKDKLKELKGIVAPIEKRIDEAAKRPESIAALRDVLKQTIEFVKGIRDQIAESEAWSSSKSAAEASKTQSSSSAAVTDAPTTTGEFDGLEDDDTSSAQATTTADPMEEVIKERGPVPPLYTEEDLKECEELYHSISKWLDEMVAKQDALPATADPVLTTAMLAEKRAALDKAGMDLAMKGVRNYEKRNPPKDKKESSKKAKASSKSSSKAAKASKTSKKSSAAKATESASSHDSDHAGHNHKAGKGRDKKAPRPLDTDEPVVEKELRTDEEIREALRKLNAEEKAKAAAPEHDEL